MTYTQLVASTVMVLAAGVIYLAAGVVGVKQAGNIKNAGMCIGMGILLVAEVIAEVIVTMNFGEFDPASVIRMLMFPAIYMVGAILNWQAKNAEKQQNNGSMGCTSNRTNNTKKTYKKINKKIQKRC